ncbi:MAG: glycine/sarcosine/betaine reductase selenoprotein B family protein [bacterium]
MNQQDTPLPYLDRIRSYYLALGYKQPYQWAQFEEVPFYVTSKPLSKLCIGLITTAAQFCSDCGDQGPGAPYNAAAKFYRVYTAPTIDDPKVYISHVGYDRHNTTAADQRSWFPLQQLKHVEKAGVIGEISQRFYGLPTNRSQATTMDRDAPDLLSQCRKDGVEAALLVANCPVCHQCCCLAARHLEHNGISTVVMGCAKDIVEHVGVPRFLFSDFPLGNAAGKPGDENSQRQTLDLALDLLMSANAPRATLQSPIKWSSQASWKNDFYNIDRLSESDLTALRKKFDEDKAVARQIRQEDGTAVNRD